MNCSSANLRKQRNPVALKPPRLPTMLASVSLRHLSAQSKKLTGLFALSIQEHVSVMLVRNRPAVLSPARPTLQTRPSCQSNSCVPTMVSHIQKLSRAYFHLTHPTGHAQPAMDSEQKASSAMRHVKHAK